LHCHGARRHPPDAQRQGLCLSTDEHKYDDVRGKAFLAQARRERRAYPTWVCEERATKPAAKRTAAQRVALFLAWGVVARRLQPHCGGCALLAPSPRPKTTQRTSSYLCSSVLSAWPAIREL